MHSKCLEVSKYYCRQLTFFPQKFLISQRNFFIIYYSYFPQMPVLLLLIKLPGMFIKKSKLCQFVPQCLSDFQPPYRVVYLKALLFNMICSLWLDCRKTTTLVSVVTRLDVETCDFLEAVEKRKNGMPCTKQMTSMPQMKQWRKLVRDGTDQKSISLFGQQDHFEWNFK